MKDWVIIYTDGACDGNPGPGGCAAVLIHPDGHRQEISEGYQLTTNNRMELMAVIRGISELSQNSHIKVFSDSQYVVHAFTKQWLKKWKNTGWKTYGHKDVKNQDLWKQLDKLVSNHNVKFEWVKGHSNNPENNRSDKLAGIACKANNLKIDAEYENSLIKIPE